LAAVQRAKQSLLFVRAENWPGREGFRPNRLPTK